MTLPNRLGYNSKQHALQKRYLQQQQQQQSMVAAHQFDPNYALSQQQLSYGTQMQANQYGAAFSQPHYQAQQLQMFNNQAAAAGMMANQGMIQTQMMSPQMSPAMSQTNQMMPSPPAKKSKKRKSQAASSNDANPQNFSTPEIQKKKKPKKKTETPENEESSANASSTPTPPSIQFGNSGIIKSPKVIKEEITQINEVFEKAIVNLMDRFKNIKIREKSHVFAIQPSLLTYKEEEKYKPKEEEIITTFPSNSNATTTSQENTEEGSASTSVAPQQSLFNSTQQVKLIQNYPVFSVNRQNDMIDNSQSLQEEEKTRRRLFYKDGVSEYLTSEDVMDEIIRDTDCYFKREMLIHTALAETPNNIISFLHTRTIQFIQNNRAKFEKFLSSADNATQLTMFLSQHEEFQPLMHQLRSVIEHAGHMFEEKTREEASSIILQSGSTADVTDEAIDQFQSTQDDMNQDYSKNVSLIEMTPRDILLVFLGKDNSTERHEDVTAFLERFKELQKQYRVECSYIDDGLKKWQDTFERALNSQSSFRIVSFEEKHRCKKSLEARFGVMKQLLKDKYLTKVLSLQENTLMRSKRRGNLPRHATNVLKSWLYSHFLHPYPTESEKKDLCMETGLTLTQVNNWFINQRVRTWRPMLESMLDGDQKEKAPSSSKPQEGKKRGKRNQQQSPIQQQTPQQPIQQQVQTQMMNQTLMGIPDSMGSPNYAYANWSSNQYGDPNFPFFPGDVTDEQQ